MMPIINGYNFCKLLKSHEDKKNVSIILLTSRDEREDIEIGMEMGADAVLINTAIFLFGSKIAFYPELSLHMMLFAVAATIIGGIGNVFGAGVAAIIIVIMQQMSVLFIGSRWQPLFVFVILFATIVFFPKGVRFRTS
jgi:hypothetical protein